MKKIILVLGIYYFLIGLSLLFAPINFYQNTPGVSMMGPYNSHFIRDVSFALISSGVALGLGSMQSLKSTIIVGALWPFMHALFHLIIWGRRDFIVDIVTLSDFLFVIVPGVLVFTLAIKSNGVRYA